MTDGTVTVHRPELCRELLGWVEEEEEGERVVRRHSQVSSSSSHEQTLDLLYNPTSLPTYSLHLPVVMASHLPPEPPHGHRWPEWRSGSTRRLAELWW